ncbi:MAG: redox-sensing transcriptional repressor Rex [Gemmatimonadaceae bacterium]|nr:redox-sensing transcriptional repressor Rex [Gemmatimonadaceae bacterium]
MKRIADSTVRRLSVYLRFVEDSVQRGMLTISSEELARRGGTTSAQVRKDLSFFGSFGKRGLGYPAAELTAALRDILGLDREWRVMIIGAGKIGTALAQYRGFKQRGFHVMAVYDADPRKIGTRWEDQIVRDIAVLEGDLSLEQPDIAVLTVPGPQAQQVADRLAAAGVRAILNFAPVQLQLPAEVTVRNVNMAMELEGLSYALANRDRNGVDGAA